MSDSRFSADTRELVREFRLADRDHDGRIDFTEFKALLDGLDSGMSAQEMHIGFREVDTDHDGLIDCNEFTTWWESD